MKVSELIKELNEFNPEDEITISMQHRKENKSGCIIEKTKLSKSLAKYTVQGLQTYLHEESKTDDEKMDLIIFERVLNRVNKIGRIYDLMKEGD